MSDEQRLRRNHQNSIAGMSDSTRMTTNQLRSSKNIQRNRTMSYKRIPQSWNYGNPCSHCSCIHLESASAAQRKKCCNNGIFLTNPKYPKLLELPIFLKNLMLHRTQHFSSRSSFYNNIFSIAVTGYDNNKQGGGAENVNGPSALKINGRAYHFFPSSSKQKFGGIANFTYDGAFQAQSHADLINGNQEDEKVNKNFVKGLSIDFYFLKIL